MGPDWKIKETSMEKGKSGEAIAPGVYIDWCITRESEPVHL
jgi:hypothetical protein